jgi:flagellar protein FliJ
MAAFRLASLLDVAGMRLESATHKLAGLRARLRTAKDKLVQLDEFHLDYSQRFQHAQQEGIEAFLQRDFRAFLAKLDRARAQQTEEVNRCRTVWEAGYREWMALRARHEALLALRARHIASERLREHRLDQKVQDEFAARQGRPLPQAE